MGTELLDAINPLASSAHCNFKVQQLYNLEDTLHKFGDSMDRIVELKGTEAIKRTMLKHEDIFKQQVKELHRLYNLQRKLMLELKNETPKIDNPRVLEKSMVNNGTQNLSTWQESRREMGFNSINLYGLTDDQQRERSGSCSGENSRIIPIRGLNLEMPVDQEGTSTSNICGSYDHHQESTKMRNIDRSYEETDVELTLSIGPSNSKKRLKSHMHKEKEISFSTSAKLERGEECDEPSPAMSTSSTTLTHKSSTQAYWFFQDLSLNRR